MRTLLLAAPKISVYATGASMTPFIFSGELVTIQRVDDPSALQAGDIIFFTTAHGELVLHRLIKLIGKGQALVLQAKGDNRTSPDKPISRDCVIAKVTVIEKRVPFSGIYRIKTDHFPWKMISRLIARCSSWNIIPKMISRLSRMGLLRLIKKAL